MDAVAAAADGVSAAPTRPAMPAWMVPLLAVLALTPVWLWYVRRLGDGGDEPYGLVALAAALALLARAPRAAPSPGADRAALAALGVYAALAVAGWPPLAQAATAMIALACHARGRLGRRVGVAWGALLLLSLPVVASLQFWLGGPLRGVCASAAALLLAPLGLGVRAEGAALAWAQGVVLVDAPCSGVRMLWCALVLAAAGAVWLRLAWPRALAALAWAGAVVVVGNIARAVALFVVEIGLVGGAPWWHDAIGALAFAAVALAVVLPLRALAPRSALATPS